MSLCQRQLFKIESRTHFLLNMIINSSGEASVLPLRVLLYRWNLKCCVWDNDRPNKSLPQLIWTCGRSSPTVWSRFSVCFSSGNDLFVRVAFYHQPSNHLSPLVRQKSTKRLYYACQQTSKWKATHNVTKTMLLIIVSYHSKTWSAFFAGKWTATSLKSKPRR